MSLLRDLDIRRALHASLREEHGDDPDTLVVDELGLCQGAARVDLAVVNGAINGFEIKSEADRLDRLARQCKAYGDVLDTVTLVTCARHLGAAADAIPRWWGIREAESTGDTVTLREIRQPRQNPSVDPAALSRLLWRHEALALLEQHGLAAGLRSKPRTVLWGVLATELPRVRLADGVRAALKRRSGWRSEP